MGITMIPQPSGMLLPRCTVCGKDLFSRDVLSQMRLRHSPPGGLDLTPVGLHRDLIGGGLRRDDITCSSCLQASALNYP